MTDPALPDVVTHLLEAVRALGYVPVSERTAAKLGPALRGVSDQLARDGGHLSPDVAQVLGAFEEARRRREQRAQVPQSEPRSVPQSEPGGSSTEVETRGMTTTEVAEMAGVEPRSITKAAVEGRLPATKIGGHWSFRPADVEEYVSTRS